MSFSHLDSHFYHLDAIFIQLCVDDNP